MLLWTRTLFQDDKSNVGSPEIDPEAAFLGPKLWSRSIPVPSNVTEGGCDDFSVMNIDDFLTENGFDLNEPSSTSSQSSPQSSCNDTEMGAKPEEAMPQYDER